MEKQRSLAYRVGLFLTCGSTSYSTPQELVFHSLRLRVLLQLCRLVVFVYIILYELIVLRTYAEFEQPIGAFNAWAYFPPTDAPPLTTAAGVEQVCKPDRLEDLEFIGSRAAGQFVVRNVSCVPFSPTRDTLLSTDVTLVTMRVFEHPASNAYTSHLLVGAENASFNLIHSYAVEDRWVTHPHTVVLDSDGNVVAEFPEGSHVHGLRVKDMFVWAGDENGGFDGYTRDAINNAPIARVVTGSSMIMEATFTNMQRGDPAVWRDGDRCEIRFRLVPGAWGFVGGVSHWATPSAANVTAGALNELDELREWRVGTRIQFITKGAIGEFSAQALSLSIIAALVYFELSRYLVDWIASLYMKKKMKKRQRVLAEEDSDNEEEEKDGQAVAGVVGSGPSGPPAGPGPRRRRNESVSKEPFTVQNPMHL